MLNPRADSCSTGAFSESSCLFLCLEVHYLFFKNLSFIPAAGTHSFSFTVHQVISIENNPHTFLLISVKHWWWWSVIEFFGFLYYLFAPICQIIFSDISTYVVVCIFYSITYYCGFNSISVAGESTFGIISFFSFCFY